MDTSVKRRLIHDSTKARTVGGVLDDLNVEGWEQVVEGTEGWALASGTVECLIFESGGCEKKTSFFVLTRESCEFPMS